MPSGNFAAESAASARSEPQHPGDVAILPAATPLSDLTRRVLSSSVLIPLAAAAVWSGSPWFPMMVAAFAAIMTWEWEKLVVPSAAAKRWLPLSAAAAAAVLLAGFSEPSAAWLVALAVSVFAGFFPDPAPGRGVGALPVWRAFGLAWIILPCVAIVWLRDLPEGGRAITVWLVCLVWATDIAAYVAGRTFGGPKLAPRISPKKTWSGLAGGVIGAALVGELAGNILQPTRWWQIALTSAMLAVIEQMGDLAESYAKRRFGVKDSSSLIPGHGGFLDRLDGALAVAFAVAALCVVTGENIVIWR